MNLVVVGAVGSLMGGGEGRARTRARAFALELENHVKRVLRKGLE